MTMYIEYPLAVPYTLSFNTAYLNLTTVTIMSVHVPIVHRHTAVDMTAE